MSGAEGGVGLAVASVNANAGATFFDALEEGTLPEAQVYAIQEVKALGEGIDTIRLALDIASDDVELKSTSGFFRLAIDRRFSIHGSGIVVTGSVFSGRISEGDMVTLMPQGIAAKARSLRTQDQISKTAIAGDRCAINLTGNRLNIEAIHRGNWITQNQGIYP